MSGHENGTFVQIFTYRVSGRINSKTIGRMEVEFNRTAWQQIGDASMFEVRSIDAMDYLFESAASATLAQPGQRLSIDRTLATYFMYVGPKHGRGPLGTVSLSIDAITDRLLKREDRAQRIIEAIDFLLSPLSQVFHLCEPPVEAEKEMS